MEALEAPGEYSHQTELPAQAKGSPSNQPSTHLCPMPTTTCEKSPEPVEKQWIVFWGKRESSR